MLSGNSSSTIVGIFGIVLYLPSADHLYRNRSSRRSSSPLTAKQIKLIQCRPVLLAGRCLRKGPHQHYPSLHPLLPHSQNLRVARERERAVRMSVTTHNAHLKSALYQINRPRQCRHRLLFPMSLLCPRPHRLLNLRKIPAETLFGSLLAVACVSSSYRWMMKDDERCTL